MARPAVLCALPSSEATAVAEELSGAGIEVIRVQRADEAAAVLATRRDVGIAIVDGDYEAQSAFELYDLVHGSSALPTLIVATPRALEKLAESRSSAGNDEFLMRPYSAESILWRVEAMLIRAQTVDDGSGPVLRHRGGEGLEFGRRSILVAVFNPKGGVGKTTISSNLAVALQARRGQKVLLVDADTVSGHIAISLGLDKVQTVADAWEQDEMSAGGLESIAMTHTSGTKVVVLAANPLQIDHLPAAAIAELLSGTSSGFDAVVVDLHPDYGPLNRAIFERCDRILVPVTPDLPAIRAAMQFVEIAGDLKVRDRVAMVINRANSGVSVEDMEKTVGMKAFGQIRSGGLLFVQAANEGTTVIEKFPREKVTGDFEALADAVLARPKAAPQKGRFTLFGRSRETARA